MSKELDKWLAVSDADRAYDLRAEMHWFEGGEPASEPPEIEHLYQLAGAACRRALAAEAEVRRLETEERARGEGYSAGLAGRGRINCPYDRSDRGPEYEAWCEGWSAGSDRLTVLKRDAALAARGKPPA